MEDIGSKTKKLVDWLGAGSINIFGRPFSGKDTQAKVLAQLFNASVIGGGDIIRSSGHKGMNDYISTGQLTPQDEYLRLILPYLERPEFNNRALILSSLGRWHGEEESIMQGAKSSGHPIKAVIHLEIDEETVLKRWQTAKKLGDRGNREDDNPNSIKTRLSEFRNKTRPVLDFYHRQGLLLNIDGNQPREDVTASVFTALVQKAVM